MARTTRTPQQQEEDGDWMVAAMAEAAKLQAKDAAAFARRKKQYIKDVLRWEAQADRVAVRDAKYGIHTWRYWSAPSMEGRCIVCGWQRSTHDLPPRPTSPYVV